MHAVECANNNSSIELRTPRIGLDWMCMHRNSGGTSTRVHVTLMHQATASQSWNQCTEDMKERRGAERRILEVEHSSFAPLVFCAVGEMGTAATVMYKRLASLLVDI